MSAKSVSKMCNFVHKSVKNAHFSPRKVQKRGFFAGGRGDFLAGQKRGFLGSGRSRRRAGARHFFVHVSRDRKRQYGRFSPIFKIKMIFGEVFFERIVTKYIIVCSYRHSELAERTESVIHSLFLIFLSKKILV